MLRNIAMAAIVALTLAASNARAADNWVPITNLATGSGKCLDVVAGTGNNTLIIADCHKFSGQEWIITKNDNPAARRLRTTFTGTNKCLDISTEKGIYGVQMALCGRFTGQNWSFVPAPAHGTFLLKTEFTGANNCLDAGNGKVGQLRMITCVDNKNQFWVIPGQ
jgi:hypothetical protein